MELKAYIEDYEKIVCFTDGAQYDYKVYSDGVSVPVSCVTVSPYDCHEVRLLLGARLNPETPCFVLFSSQAVPAEPLGIYDKAEFIERYSYNGKLGVEISGEKTTFRLWSPFALAVKLNLYKNGQGGYNLLGKHMTRSEKGVWILTIDGNLDGAYYTYTVSHNGRADEEIVDPYAYSTGVNGRRGMVTDLFTDVTPDGWEKESEEYKKSHALKQYTDAVIWEVHVRDFSGKTNSRYPRTFKAFTESLKNASGESIGVDYLADLGVTHVHFLPVAEYATVDQTRLADNSYNAFNWGYDPMNYNSPMGAYSTNPYDGKVKVYELREAVASLHKRGMGVVFDVVYNHTYDFKAPLSKAVPNYYYRFDYRGNPTNGSGCGNETASERVMCRKFIIDSLLHWAKTYHADGFRFDLMGLHDVDTMQEIERALHVYDKSMLIYGEGWVGGATSLDGDKQCNKWNSARIKPMDGSAGGVAVFSDVMRDSVKGAVFSAYEGGYVNDRAYETVNLVKFSSMGGTSPNFNTWWVTPSASQVVNYVSAHDNLALWDKLSMTSGIKPTYERVAMNKMAGGIIFTSRGIPFMQAGEEMLRSKTFPTGGYDENSYKSPDVVNNIEWDLLVKGSARDDVRNYYKGLIAFRKAHPALRITDPEEIENATNFLPNMRYDVIAYTLEAEGESLFIVYNPLGDAKIPLPEGKWSLRVNGDRAGNDCLGVYEKEITVQPKSVWALVRV